MCAIILIKEIHMFTYIVSLNNLFFGMSQICSRTFLHDGSVMYEGILFHEDTFVRRDIVARRRFYTTTILHGG